MGARDDGPHGVLVRDVLINAAAYGSSPEFLRVPEVIGDICFAARNDLKIDLEGRFLQATTSCIVEFSVEADEVKAPAAACWYAEAHCAARPPVTRPSFSGKGVSVPPRYIVGVEILDALPP
jgi:hypothetical protein